MNSHTLKLTQLRNILLVAGVVLLALLVAVIARSVQSEDKSGAADTVQLSALHPTYSSVDDITSSPEAAFVGQAVVLDEGTVRSNKIPGDPAEAPPEVHTDYTLQVTSLIHGKDTSPQITIAVMGGVVEGKRYTYEGVPQLKKGDTIIVFASLGNDGKYYPLAGSTAIATQQQEGKSTFTLSEATIPSGKTTFSEQDLRKQP